MPRGTTVLVVIDQFEELFTHTVDEGARRAFVQMLVDTAGQPDAVVRIVVTLRADFLDRPLGYAGFADAIKGRTIALGAMSAAEMAEAIRRPAAGVGVDVEPALVDRITADAERRTGRAAARPAPDGRALRPADGERRHPRRLRGVGRSGRRHRAARRGDLPASSTTAPGRRRGRCSSGSSAWTRSTRTPAAGCAAPNWSIPVSAPTSSTWCCASTAATGCSRSTAMRPPGHRRSRSPTRRCSASGPRLRDWIDDARDDLLTRRRIESAAHDWLAAGSDASFLFTGGRLELAESWAAESGFELTEDEQRFLTDEPHAGRS